MELRIMEGTLDRIQENIPFEKLNDYLNTPVQNWLDISAVCPEDFDRLSSTLIVPKMMLESRFSNECYPQIDYFEHYSLIFARITEGELNRGTLSKLAANQNDLMVVCHGNDIITISNSRHDLFDKIHERAKKYYGPEEPLAVTILYAIFKYMIEENKRVVSDVEKKLIEFENQPVNKRPTNFLETTFHLRKEINQLITALLHFKEIISEINSRSVPLEGFSDRHEKRFQLLLDEISFVYESATFARDSVIYLVDLYMNTTSYETNKVMRVIAVITCLGMLPTIFGLLGSNIIGNPWEIELWQVFVLLGGLMATFAFIFYKVGWLKS